MNATVSPIFALNDIFFKTYSSASGYLNDTFLNSTVPTSLVTPSKSPSTILTFVSSTSLILPAETCDLGSITNINASIKKDIIICIAYDENTTISPNKPILSTRPASLIKYAPIKYIISVNIYIIRYITGAIIDIVFWLNNCKSVKLLLALSNLFSW